jgi:hypothetical protein
LMVAMLPALFRAACEGGSARVSRCITTCDGKARLPGESTVASAATSWTKKCALNYELPSNSN